MNERTDVPVVVVLFHREEDTRLMLEQLARVTEGYSLIIVDNGFDDRSYIDSLEPATYIANAENLGVSRAVNQGIDAAGAEYVAVLHSDVLIYEEGWLDHALRFLERRRDVGLVGLAGRHCILEDGRLDHETTVVDMRCYGRSMRPTWRFTEVAAIDGLGWVMRDVGLRLDERYSYMHYYDVDLSLQYLEAGHRVYVMATEIDHLAEQPDRSSRVTAEYLDAIGGDDAAYFESARPIFRDKWQGMLPVTRGYRDEVYAENRIEELRDQIRSMGEHIEKVDAHSADLSAELSRAAAHIDMVEAEYGRKSEEVERLKAIISGAQATEGLRPEVTEPPAPPRRRSRRRNA